MDIIDLEDDKIDAAILDAMGYFITILYGSKKLNKFKIKKLLLKIISPLLWDNATLLH